MCLNCLIWSIKLPRNPPNLLKGTKGYEQSERQEMEAPFSSQLLVIASIHGLINKRHVIVVTPGAQENGDDLHMLKILFVLIALMWRWWHV